MSRFRRIPTFVYVLTIINIILFIVLFGKTFRATKPSYVVEDRKTSKSFEENYQKIKNMTNGVAQLTLFQETIGIIHYDMSALVPDNAKDIECILLSNATPPYHVCLHDVDTDIYLSKHLKTAYVWEPHIQNLIEEFFIIHTDAMYLDLGMNIGTHSLYAANLNKNIKVLAVEPFPKNVLRAHKAAHLNKVQNQIKVIMAAISDKRGDVTFHEKGRNVAGNIMIYQGSHTEKLKKGFTTTSILFDDLLPFIKVDKALLKMDIEGQECHAFFNADKLFAEIDIPIVLMEILYSKKENPFCFEAMLSFFTARNYKAFYFPYKSNDTKSLDNLRWREWYGRDVYFKKFYTNSKRSRIVKTQKVL